MHLCSQRRVDSHWALSDLDLFPGSSGAFNIESYSAQLSVSSSIKLKSSVL